MIATHNHHSYHNPQAYISTRSIAVNYVGEATSGRNVAIAYIYCDYKNAETQSEVKILASITRQLAEQTYPLPPEVKVFCDKDAPRRRKPTDGERISLLRSLCLLFQTTYVFIDALVILPCLAKYFHDFQRDNLAT